MTDKTGLAGKYTFTLTWLAAGHEVAASSDDSAESSPSLFTALEEQLGLKLQPSKGPTDTLVVDHIETPTEN